MIVVSNSSPLIALARISQLNLLATLYRRILIPPEVRHEVTVAGRGLPGAEQVSKARHIARSWAALAFLKPGGGVVSFEICARLTPSCCGKDSVGSKATAGQPG